MSSFGYCCQNVMQRESPQEDPWSILFYGVCHSKSSWVAEKHSSSTSKHSSELLKTKHDSLITSWHNSGTHCGFSHGWLFCNFSSEADDSMYCAVKTINKTTQEISQKVAHAIILRIHLGYYKQNSSEEEENEILSQLDILGPIIAIPLATVYNTLGQNVTGRQGTPCNVWLL